MNSTSPTKSLLQKRFSELPNIVQKTISSNDPQTRLRSLADKYNLHLDQWEILETEVLLALYGMKPAESLEENIAKEAKISTELAGSITEDIAVQIFKPIREELERGLGAPQARDEVKSDLEKLRHAAIADAGPEISGKTASVPTSPVPATPATPPPTEKVARAPASGSYIPGQVSSERKVVVDDPYREPPM